MDVQSRTNQLQLTNHGVQLRLTRKENMWQEEAIMEVAIPIVHMKKILGSEPSQIIFLGCTQVGGRMALLLWAMKLITVGLVRYQNHDHFGTSVEPG